MEEARKPGAKANFIVLARFGQPVEAPLVFITEALMTILFGSWNNRVFLKLQPSFLLRRKINWGLNTANPLDHGVASYMRKEHPDIPSDRYKSRAHYIANGRRRATQRKAELLDNARSGGPVKVTVQHVRSKHLTFQFQLLGETFRIPSPLALSLGLDQSKEVNVEYKISADQHPFAYATKARWKDETRKLGVRLTGYFSHGPRKGEPFKRWIHCSSGEAISRVRRVMRVLAGAWDDFTD
jgi:hypothetical protein